MQVTLPFLVLHGEADVVTDPAVSKGLHRDARSFDKTLIMYPGMWHGLLFGEPEDNIDNVFRDIISWLNDRSPNASDNGCNSPPFLSLSNLSLIQPNPENKEFIHQKVDGFPLLETIQA